MNPEEYQKLEALDREHWFYAGKRAIVRHWIDRFAALTPDSLLVDGGVGTGTWLAEMRHTCRVLGIDDHDESLSISGPKLDGAVLKASLHQVDLPDNHASVVTLLDVLEHVVDDAAALREMIRITRPGGLLIITVPALPWLWSDWDEILHHQRRYYRRDLLRLIRRPGVEVLRCAYTNSWALPAMVVMRFLRRLIGGPPSGKPRAEERLPPAWLNRLFQALYVKPACWFWFRPPLGASLLAILRKRPDRDSPSGGDLT
ncbi:MAG: class I SAM-dependent methyltransferase [Phycisphaerales bacterium]|nr:MAG: class I SAM-dependent methyltransferase [Phycisphaerales bacterium]